MRLRLHQLSAALFLFCVINTSATVLYVDLNSTNPVPPYADKTTAATNVQDAVDAATGGDSILVTDGVYQTGGRVIYGSLTNRVAVTKAVTVRSVNGPMLTMIDGGGVVRCVYLTNGAALSGFTMTNGTADNGGGAWCESVAVVVSNCVLAGNSAGTGGGVQNGTLNNCILAGNSADWIGGGASGSILNSCLLTDNSSYFDGGAGECTLNNCTIRSNVAYADSAAVEASTLNNCILSGNHSTVEGLTAWDSMFNNCIIVGNSAGVGGCTLNNCVLYYTGDTGGGNTFNYCCMTPLPDSGAGNFTNAPIFVDQAGGNLHLQTNSPCINAGNNAYVTITNDLDNNPRIVGGTVDIGAYEFQSPSSLLSYAWAQQYGLSTDGSADFIDTDHDGMNNWQEWIAGTVPTNALSVLEMLSPSKSISGTSIKWQSVPGINYYLQRNTNLFLQPAFSSIQSNLVGQANTTSFIDTNANGFGPYFYRVGVQR